MNAVLQEIGKKLAERWVTLLVLPGVLLAATALVAFTLRHGRAFDLAHLVGVGTTRAKALDKGGGVAIALAVVATLLASVALGLLAQWLGTLIRALWIGRWPWPLRGVARRLTKRRHGRWTVADGQVTELALAEPVHRDGLTAALHRRNAIALAPPARPTWMGDRIAGVDTRVSVDYQVQLAVVWPRLWLVLPEDVRAEVRAVADAFDGTARLCGWGLLYLGLGTVWWPVGPIGAGIVVTGWWRGRAAAGGLADLLESVVDLYGADLARKLGVGDEKTTLGPAVGMLITERIRKGA